MQIFWLPIEKVIPYDKNPRDNAEAVKEVKKSLQEFGWQQVLLVDKDHVLVVGHTRLEAAKELGMKKVPVKYANGPKADKQLTAAQIKAYRIMDNRTGEFAKWKPDLLLVELEDVFHQDAKFTPDFVGFELEKVNQAAKQEEWSLNQARDESVITIRCSLQDQAAVLEILKPMQQLTVQVSNVKRFG